MSTKQIIANYPLSSMQQGMLLQNLRDGGSYIQQMVWDLKEELRPAQFFQAWQDVVARHDILRTSFRWEGIPEPIQYVHEKVGLPWRSKDWSHLPAAQQEKDLANFLRSDRKTGFDVTRPPLMRFALFRLGEMHHRLVWTFHHALLDGRSHATVLSEVFAIYDASLSGTKPTLRMRRPYGEYINWLQRQDWSNAKEFWSEYLRGFKPLPDLRIDAEEYSAGQANRTHRPAQKSELPDELTSALKLIAEQNDLTLNTMVQAGWALLLSRYYGSEDIVFGATRACRHSLEDSEAMVGLFINTLPLRVRVNPQQPLLEWLKDLRRQQVVFRDYEQTPLTKIQDWSEAPRGRSLFETVLVFENFQLNEHIQNFEGNWQGRHFELLEQTDFPLTLAVYAGSRLLLRLEYDERRFDAASIQRLLSHLTTLLEGMARDLTCSVGQLPMLNAAEHQQLLFDWNQTTRTYRSDVCLHQLFSEQVKRAPNATAVIFEDEQINFSELDARANQLAHHLRARGVGPEVLVGICMDRSIEMVVALLSVLKAGGAYLPLAPEYPPERLAFMVADAGVKILLTQRSLKLDLDLDNLDLIYLGKDGPTFSSEPTHVPESGVQPDNPAYVIYTSGSTGKPKGVVLTHSAICNHMQWMQEEFPLTQADSVLQKTPISFDASVWEFYAPLLAGARLVMLGPGGVKHFPYLLEAIQRYEVTTLQLVPSLLSLLLEEKDFANCRSLKRVFCGGEPLTPALVERFLSCSNADLINLYGPTEACIDATFWLVDRERSGKIVSLGRSIANTESYVLSKSWEPMPVGVSGELYLAGAGLARGYLRRPDLTAERFLPNLFSPVPGARWYRTGDLAHYLPDGSIAYEGRADRQIKFHGFRIELGEIESCLARHPAVFECAVEVKGSSLAAYVVARLGPITPGELRSFLAARLPGYMVPSVFVQLGHLPLTENGKLDRDALPAPFDYEVDNEVIGPRNATEEIIAGIWSEVLRRKNLGVLEDFFELGGDSLQAIQVFARIAEAFRIDLPMGALFEHRTVGALAAAVEEKLIDELSRASEDDVARASRP